MIKIDWKALVNIADSYVERLELWAKIHPRSYLARLILGQLDISKFRSLILCPPHRLSNYPCPEKVAPEHILSTYTSFFYSEGADGEKNAMWLMKQLDIHVCPYCNRTYTFSVNEKKAVRPEIDHFYPKSDPRYMHLALSFYNLVPSCPICNHTKSDTVLDFHPYLGPLDKPGLLPRFLIDSTPVKYGKKEYLFPESPIIKIENVNSNVMELALEELYRQHSDYAKEILDKMQAYNESLYEPLIAGFQGIGKTSEEIDRLVWGNYVERAFHSKRPLAKLTRDILEQFGVIDI